MPTIPITKAGMFYYCIFGTFLKAKNFSNLPKITAQFSKKCGIISLFGKEFAKSSLSLLILLTFLKYF